MERPRLIEDHSKDNIDHHKIGQGVLRLLKEEKRNKIVISNEYPKKVFKIIGYQEPATETKNVLFDWQNCSEYAANEQALFDWQNYSEYAANEQ